GLRAVGAVFGTSAGLHRKQRAEPDLARGERLAVVRARLIDELEERRVVDRSHLCERPVVTDLHGRYRVPQLIAPIHAATGTASPAPRKAPPRAAPDRRCPGRSRGFPRPSRKARPGPP